MRLNQDGGINPIRAEADNRIAAGRRTEGAYRADPQTSSAGDTGRYGGTWTARRPTRLAIVSAAMPTAIPAPPVPRRHPRRRGGGRRQALPDRGADFDGPDAVDVTDPTRMPCGAAIW